MKTKLFVVAALLLLVVSGMGLCLASAAEAKTITYGPTAQESVEAVAGTTFSQAYTFTPDTVPAGATSLSTSGWWWNSTGDTTRITPVQYYWNGLGLNNVCSGVSYVRLTVHGDPALDTHSTAPVSAGEQYVVAEICASGTSEVRYWYVVFHVTVSAGSGTDPDPETPTKTITYGQTFERAVSGQTGTALEASWAFTPAAAAPAGMSTYGCGTWYWVDAADADRPETAATVWNNIHVEFIGIDVQWTVNLYGAPEHLGSSFPTAAGEKYLIIPVTAEGTTEIVTYKVVVHVIITANGEADPTPTIATITYDANGGTGVIAPCGCRVGSMLTLPDAGVSRTGYTLAGWALTADATTAFLDYMPTGDVTLFAVWAPEAAPFVTVTFNANGGTGVISPIRVAPGAAVTLPDGHELTQPNYVFIGWALTADDHTPLTSYAAPAGSATVYAIWARSPHCTVTFDANGGAGTISAQETAVDQEIVLPTEGVTRDGCRLAGWALTADDQVALGATYAPAGDVTLFAVWKDLQQDDGYHGGVLPWWAALLITMTLGWVLISFKNGWLKL